MAVNIDGRDGVGVGRQAGNMRQVVMLVVAATLCVGCIKCWRVNGMRGVCVSV